jgi:aminoglycoside phosphotransferase (APT) family kinase protein
MRSLRKVSDAQGAVVEQDTGKPVGPIPRLDEMFGWFKRNEAKDQATIVHGDFKIDNLVNDLKRPSSRQI